MTHDVSPHPPASTFFWRLGQLVDSLWRARNLNEDAFSEVATEALRRMPPSENVGWLEVAREFFLPVPDAHGWPPQRPSSFGQPPLLLYHGNRFYIEMLCWMDGTTSIHSHGFSGAFHVLHGSSIHGQYQFHEKKRVNDSLLLGDVEFMGIELLAVGDTRPIRAGSGFIHSLFHLDQPSVTIVVRTILNPASLPQYDYFKPHVAENLLCMDEEIAKQRKLLHTLGLADPIAFEGISAEFVRRDFQSAWMTLQVAYSLWGDSAIIHNVLDILRPLHGNVVDLLPRVLEDKKYRETLVSMRAKVTDAELRFFLALLLNVPDRISVQRIVSQRFQDDPRARVVRWLRQLTTVDDAGQITLLNQGMPALLPALPPPLAAEPFFVLMEGLLEGRSLDAVKKRMTHDFPSAQVEAGSDRISTAVAAMQHSMLRPLVAG